MNYSPILVSVYNRENHFRKCIESLRECELSRNSPLFIAIDAPYKDEDVQVNQRIIQYSKNISGFKEVILFIRPENYGTNKNRRLAREEIFSKYDKLIMFEDDNLFSTKFLLFLNKALDAYNTREDIFSISGYQYPFTIPKNYEQDIYIWQGFSAWGVGIWREKWNQMKYSSEKIESWLNNKEHLKKLDQVSQHYRHALKTMNKRNQISGDGFISSYLIEHDMYSVFPTQTLVKNIGHDGMGNNKFISKKFLKQEIYNGPVGDLPYAIKPNEIINKRLWWYFSNINRFKNRGDALVNRLFKR